MTPTNSFATDSILPPDPDDLEVLHDREYRVRAYRSADDRLLIRGAVRDQKPPGMYVEGDPDPLTVHHMQVELEVAFPSLEIVRAHAALEIHPNTTCPRIEDHYGELVGLSHRPGVHQPGPRALRRPPRMHPHDSADPGHGAGGGAVLLVDAGVDGPPRWHGRPVPAARRRTSRHAAWQFNIGSCHVWAEDGEQVATLRSGGTMEVPVWMQGRLRALGRDPKDWVRGMQGRGSGDG